MRTKPPQPRHIKRWRERFGLSRAELGRLMGVSRMTVYNWEHGVHPMKPATHEYMMLKLRGL